MSDSVIEAARNRTEVIRGEIAELEGFIKSYEKIAHIIGQKTKAKPTPHRKLVEMAVGILKQHQPRSTRDLYDLLTDQGAIVNGRNPVGNLGAKLSQSPELRNVIGKGWMLAVNTASFQEGE